MADGVTFSATGQSPPANTVIWTDEVTIGLSTMHVQIIKLANPTLDSTAMMGMTSGGMNVAVVNTTINVSESSVFVKGNSTAIISTASKIVVDTLTTGSIVRVDSIASFPAGSSNVVISGNSTAIISTASKIIVDTLTTGSIIRVDSVASLPQSSVTISTGGAGGSTGNPLFVTLQPMTQAAGSTWSNSSITSTAAATPFSSAASTRFNLTGIIATNKGATLTVMSIWTGSTAGTLLFKQALSSAGGGFTWNGVMATPYGTTGAQITVECVPASTTYLHLDAYRSS